MTKRLLPFLLSFLSLLAMTSCHAATETTTSTKHVALLFDDGPHPEFGPKFIELFKSEGISVTFAQVATNMQQHGEITLAMLEAGHEILNHSHDHKHPSDLNDEELTHEILGAQKTIAEIIGKDPKWYWPPFLEVDDRVRNTIENGNLTLYPTPNLVSSDDWNKDVTADQIRENATAGITDATVILFHEWREETYEQMPAILESLRKQNCKFLTMTELQQYHSSQVN